MELENNLFRFSVLRGPDGDGLASAATFPSVTEDDSLNQVVSEAVAFVEARDPSVTRVGDVVNGLQLPPSVDPAMADGAAAFDLRVLRGMIETAARGEVRLERHRVAEISRRLTMAAFLKAYPTLDEDLMLADWILKNPIVVENLLPPSFPWKPRQGLARPPGVADHYVVRDTLLGYRMGEIEDIKNYLRGEVKQHNLSYLTSTEEQTLSETEDQTDRTEETATQQRSKLSAAAQSTADSSLGFDARVQTEGQYGPTRVNTDIGFQFASSSSESRQSAAEFSNDVVSRSVEQVRKRELKRVTRTIKTELRETRRHAVDNKEGEGHTIGIYRWVESVWKATTYRIGPRLILEFLIPEPGRPALMAAKAVPPSDLPPAPPPLPDNLFATIDAAEAARLAILYGANGIKAPPLESQTIGVPFGATEFKDKPEQRVGAIVVKEVKVPDGYVAQGVAVIATAMDRADTDVVSNIVVNVPGGRPATFLGIEGGQPNPFMVSGGPGEVGRPTPDLRTYGVSVEGNFGPGATIPVTIYSEDTRGVAGYVELFCRASDAAVEQWKLDTVQALTAAYRTRLSEWEAQKLTRSFAAPLPAPAPDLDALCRHACISSLLGTWPPATGRSDANGWPAPGALANATGELILFLEQAFEWNNLQYVLYPHYWAEEAHWPDLMAADHPNPKVREFMRSGAARMVVPVALTMSESVLFFLDTGLPWFGGGAPIPGEPGYEPIADEIRMARGQPSDADEVVGEHQFTLPTSLVILQDSGILPAPPA